MKDFTANAEAHEIINSFYFQLPNNGSISTGINSCSSRMEEAEKCAIILVEKILKVLEEERVFERLEYYQEVKTQIVCIIFQKK